MWWQNASSTRRRIDEIEDVLVRADLGAGDRGPHRHRAACTGASTRRSRRMKSKPWWRRRSRRCSAGVAQPLAIDPAHKTVRHPGRRRQRLRQDHDHRQAGGEIARRGPHGDAGGGRHVPRRGHRSAQDLGGAHRRVVHRARSRRRCRRFGIRRGRGGETKRRRRAADRHRRPPAEPHRIDGRAGKGRAGDEEGRAVGAACRAAGARRHRRPERAVAGRDFRQARRRHRPRHDQARRHRARRHSGRHRREVQSAGAFHRRRRGRRRSGAVLGARFCPRHRRARCRAEFVWRNAPAALHTRRS